MLKDKDTGKMILRSDNLVKMYGRRTVVKGVSLNVHQGEIVGLLGPNGAGKTTTMKIVTGFIPQTKGTAEVCGYDVEKNPMEVRTRIGYLPEHNPLYKDLYVKEYLSFVAGLHKVPNKKRRVAEMIEMTGLEREQKKVIGSLSKGYRQRVGLAQAMLHDPEVLILDEPTSGLDPNQLAEIRELIKTLGKEKTVIFSSHILSEVEAIAERVVIIDRGKMVADTPTAQLSKLSKDETQIAVEFDKPGFDMAEIEQEAGVSRVETLEGNLFRIYTEADIDIRRRLFEVCVAQENVILSLHKETYTLEDAFRKLTGDK